MFKKVKKHKLSLFLLAMVAMLSVYYVLMPEDGPAAPVGNVPTGETRYQEFAEVRLEILDDRNSMVASYEAKIIDATVSLLEVETIILEIETITSLTEKEVYLEKVIKGLGYEDSLVYLDNNVLNISVLSDSLSKDEYIDIAVVAAAEFGEDLKFMINYISISS